MIAQPRFKMFEANFIIKYFIAQRSSHHRQMEEM